MQQISAKNKDAGMAIAKLLLSISKDERQFVLLCAAQFILEGKQPWTAAVLKEAAEVHAGVKPKIENVEVADDEDWLSSYHKSGFGRD